MIKKPRRLNKSFLNTANMKPIKGVVLHNDYGSANATAEWYLNSFLPNHQLEKGIAHYYIDKDVIGRAVHTYQQAWHTGNAEGNGHYIGFEIVGSRWDNGLSTEAFKENEEMVFRQAAEDLAFYGLPVNRNTVRLHKEFSSTSCPHRSWDLHGKSVNAVKDYFISRIKHYQSLGKTVDEMIDAENGKKNKSKNHSKNPDKDGKTKLFKVGDKVKLTDKASHWHKWYDKLVRQGGTRQMNGKIADHLKNADFKVTYLNSNGTIELAQVIDDKQQPQRYVAYEWDIEKDDSLYKVQTGAFSKKENAERKADELKKDGYDTYITKD